MKFARLTNAEYDEIERKSPIPLDLCPTCGSKPFTVSDADLGEAEGRNYGTYRYKGQEHACDCDTQMRLYRHYLAANIGEQYMRLDWADYRNEEVREGVDSYLTMWESFRRQGMGFEFGGEGLGVGKTFAATYVGKELVKRGQKVAFVPFLDFKRLFDRMVTNDEGSHALFERYRNVTVLILDELRPPVSEAAQGVFSDRLEELVRHRTNYNLPTIISTNLTEEELTHYYPRPYSLLRAKQVRKELTGKDARATWIGERNLDLALNDEVAPIT